MEKTRSVNEWVDEVHKNAKEHGWHDKQRSALEVHMLCVSELAEATEEVRSGRDVFYWGQELKPEGEKVELVDCVIRIWDYFGEMGWDFEDVLRLKHEYNKSRAYRHGGKRY